ncbi:hypothetical protein [Kribbella sp. CA-294648]|uniref:hypothetical protein n=1 Tax=Kribbella sp. CA-294648 TaxID=3239948 RepID=UPI003D94F711
MNESFTVGLDQQEVLRRRAAVRRTRMIGGSVVLLLAAVGAGLGITLAIMLGQYWPFGLLMVVSMLITAVPTLKAMTMSEELKRWYDGAALPPYAMRMTPAALELGVEGAAAPVVLPWPAVSGLRVERRYGQPVLEVVLHPGVEPTSPGVLGLDQPTAKAALRPSKWLKPAGFYGVASLDQPVEAIAQAVHYFSQGQAVLR